ncbi:hypothetical protein [Kitasatospora purpeofusca]|uniref:hypothetical protein n=1 Tax=Kitasatospora purpeofusca TaxID=67352 RepID=UPI0038650021|nr:hypothetical protein OIP63_11010 [Kitasatospora purpeofusca]
MDHQQDPWAALLHPPVPSARLGREWLGGMGLNPAAPEGVLLALLDVGHADFLLRPDLPPAVLDAASASPHRRVWGRAADSGRLSAAQWERLLTARAGEPDHALLTDLAADADASRERVPRRRGIAAAPEADARPPATPEEIAELADAVPDIDPRERTIALFDDPDAMRQLAGSPRLRIRRSVARAPRLPTDVVELLARDEDFAVRLFLTESCDDAPSWLLLDLWADGWNGTLSFPGRPRNHPGFPRTDLLRFADDPHPRLRLLALDDPAAPAALAERLAHDPDPEVRAHAAEDPRLTPATAAALTTDPSADVRRHAHRHPALPPALLVALLQDPATAGNAATNPAVPVAVMHGMIAAAAERAE